MNRPNTNPAPLANAGEEAYATQSPASIQAHLAWLRTRMALETTLAGWVRTASALIAFGFAIVQFFENYKVTQVSNGNHLARYLGLVLIGIGSVATAVAVWEYRKVMEKMMNAGGLEWFATDDPEICSHPANCLMARIGKRVNSDSIFQFDQLRFQNRFMY